MRSPAIDLAVWYILLPVWQRSTVLILACWVLNQQAKLLWAVSWCWCIPLAILVSGREGWRGEQKKKILVAVIVGMFGFFFQFLHFYKILVGVLERILANNHMGVVHKLAEGCLKHGAKQKKLIKVGTVLPSWCWIWYSKHKNHFCIFYHFSTLRWHM